MPNYKQPHEFTAQDMNLMIVRIVRCDSTSRLVNATGGPVHTCLGIKQRWVNVLRGQDYSSEGDWQVASYTMPENGEPHGHWDIIEPGKMPVMK